MSARKLVGVAALLAGLLAAGCARDTPLPLPGQAALGQTAPEAAAPGQPIGLSTVALLAVRDNPDLRAARLRRGVAQAQVLQAGILPNPQISSAYFPNLYAPAATTTAWSAAISGDVRALVTYSARRASVRAAAQQVDADLLWQEWQVIGKARLLAVQLIAGAAQAQALEDARDKLRARLVRARLAVAQGNLTLTGVAPDVAALADLDRQADDLARLMQTRWHDFDALLGLAPQVRMKLPPFPDLPPVPPLAEILPGLAQRRPDLVALQLGYRSQEAAMRAAILGQFPALSLGIGGGEDNTNDFTVGPQIIMDLPIFDRNQGNIALARATRAQLRAEYTARLDAATGEAAALVADLALVARQQGIASARLREADRAAAEAGAAFAAGNLDERGWLDLVLARLARAQDVAALQQAAWEQTVALATLAGAGMPMLAPALEEPPT